MQISSLSAVNQQNSTKVNPVSFNQPANHAAFNRMMQQLTFGIVPSIGELRAQAPVYELFFDMVKQVTPSALAPEKTELKAGTDDFYKNRYFLKKVERLETLLTYQQDKLELWDQGQGNLEIFRGRTHGLPNRSMVVKIKGSSGYEHHQPLMFLVHNDIVAKSIKNPFRKIEPKIVERKDGNWVVTKGDTTLGADNKAGGAAVLAMAKYYLENPTEVHVPVEIAILSDEEHGSKSLDGVIRSGLLQGKNAIVPDGGDDIHILNTGMAGTSAVSLPIKGLKKATPKEMTVIPVDVHVKGLLGGHSGMEFSTLDPNSLIRRFSTADIAADIWADIRKEAKEQGLPENTIQLKGFKLDVSAHNQIPPAGDMQYVVTPSEHQQHAIDIINASIQKVYEKTEQQIQSVINAANKKDFIALPELSIELKQSEVETQNINPNDFVMADIQMALTQRLESSKIKLGQQNAPNEHVGKLVWNVYGESHQGNTGELKLYMRGGTAQAIKDGEGLLGKIAQSVQTEFSEQYPDLSIGVNREEKYPVWEFPKGEDPPFVQLCKTLAETFKRKGVEVMATTNLGAAFPNKLAPLKNKLGEFFEPILVAAWIRNMHASTEEMQVKSLKRLRDFIVEAPKAFALNEDLAKMLPSQKN